MHHVLINFDGTYYRVPGTLFTLQTLHTRLGNEQTPFASVAHMVDYYRVTSLLLGVLIELQECNVFKLSVRTKDLEKKIVEQEAEFKRQSQQDALLIKEIKIRYNLKTKQC